jgi:hypothetical protein
MSKTAPATLICEICKKPKSPHDGMLAELIRPSLLEFIIHCHFIAIFVALLAKFSAARQTRVSRPIFWRSPFHFRTFRHRPLRFTRFSLNVALKVGRDLLKVCDVLFGEAYPGIAHFKRKTGRTIRTQSEFRDRRHRFVMHARRAPFIAFLLCAWHTQKSWKLFVLRSNRFSEALSRTFQGAVNHEASRGVDAPVESVAADSIRVVFGFGRAFIKLDHLGSVDAFRDNFRPQHVH